MTTKKAKPAEQAEVAVEQAPQEQVDTAEKAEMLTEQEKSALASTLDQLNESDKQQSEPVIARVLVDLRIAGEVYHPNQLIEADSVLIDQLEDAGEVCSDDAAVEYCRSIGAQVIAIETK